MADKIRWGLMGAGGIVERWFRGAVQVQDMEIVAVASSTPESALRAAQRYSIPDAMRSCEELVKRDDLDVIYVAAPHAQHKDLAILAMEHGKAVLVEKPAAVNALDLQRMIDCAKKHNVFFMEAVWTRFFPLIGTIQELIHGDVIGEVRAVNVSFSFRAPANPQSRLLNPALAGGGLLDVGVYNLHLCDMIYDQNPVELTGFAAIDTDANHFQVDEQAMIIAKYDHGALATMGCGVRTQMIDTAFIYGTKGYIEIPVFWKPTMMKVTIDGATQEYREPIPLRNSEYPDEGYQYEIMHVHDCLRNGLKESPVMTWDRSLRVLKQCDELRRQWGLKYPFKSELLSNNSSL